MPVEHVLTILALVGAVVATVAVTAASVRAFLLARRLHQLSDQLSHMLQYEVHEVLAEVAETARGLQQASGKIGAAVQPLDHVIRKVDRWAGVAAEALLASAVSPTLGRVAGALGGLKRLGGILAHGRGANGRPL